MKRNYLKRFVSEIVEITYKDGQRMVCYIDDLDDSYLIYSQQHLPDVLEILKMPVSEIEKIVKLIPESEISAVSYQD